MYNGIGLLTARGSGTSGHVQSNSFNIRSHARNPQDNGEEAKPARVRKPDDRILEHERKREIELKLVELTESLEDNGYSTAEIEKEVQEMRVQMLQEHASMTEAQQMDGLKKRDDTHALAKRKQIELERFKDAFGVRGEQAVKDADSAKQQAIEGPPEQLMIENGRPPVNDRFAAEEKALEEQLQREEEEEIAREREERMKRKAERHRRRDEKAASKTAEEARIAAEHAAHEQEKRRADEERRLAEAEQQRWRERERMHERGDRGGYSRDAYRESRGTHHSHRSGHEEYDDRGHRGSRHRENGYRERDQVEDRYMEEVGTMGRQYERHTDNERRDHKRRRVAEEEMHEQHAPRGREREHERGRVNEGRWEDRYSERDRESEYRERDWRSEGAKRIHDESHRQGDGEDSRRIHEAYAPAEKHMRSEHSERSNGRGGSRAHAREDERQHRRGRLEEGEENDRIHEKHASRRHNGGREGDEGHEYDRQAAREGHRERERQSDRARDCEGRREREAYEGREVDDSRRGSSTDKYGGHRYENRREPSSRVDRREPSGYELDRRDERGGEKEGGQEHGRVDHDHRHRPEGGYEERGRRDEDAGNAKRRSVPRGRSRSESPANSGDSLSFGTSSSDDE